MKRSYLEFHKAGKVCKVEIVGSQKSIDRLCRSLETDSGVDFYSVSDVENNISLN